jgi:hypothetical protein
MSIIIPSFNEVAERDYVLARTYVCRYVVHTYVWSCLVIALATLFLGSILTKLYPSVQHGKTLNEYRSSRFMMLHQRSRSLLLLLDNVCHRSSYIPITQNIEARGFVSYAISCYCITLSCRLKFTVSCWVDDLIYEFWRFSDLDISLQERKCPQCLFMYYVSLRQLSLNEGAHQLRMFNQGPNGVDPMTDSSFRDAGSRVIPCASVLVRLVKIPRGPGGKPVEVIKDV